ncbi:MAG: ornithine carbamoyltransferase [Candidatus Omnitrophica bacterium]|nr:ornithine carbamoyltransferase [Candidatus Omnitrophota bacterium]HOX54866.1 ornithine carbamoyltransferase [Candidatus Omnitrophota bacterium]
MKKDLISINDLSAKEIEGIFDLASKIKKNKSAYANKLKGKSVALIFQKPSNRTRVSFEVGVWQLGGNCIYLGPGEINLGVRETVEDVAKTLSRYLDAIVARTFKHSDVLDLAKYSKIPVINGLSDLSHPCQGLADLFTIKEKLGKLKGIKLAYIGDGNNVCHSLMYGCAKLGVDLKVATPKDYEPNKKVVRESGFSLKNISNNPNEAVESADVIYTDVWASMGEESEAEERRRIFKDFQINGKLVSKARKNYLFMHCLPAHRGEEVSSDVMDSKNSIVFDQAENRLHVQKAILLFLLA